MLTKIKEINERINAKEEEGQDATRDRAQLDPYYRDLSTRIDALTASLQPSPIHLKTLSDHCEAAYQLCYGRMEDDPQTIPAPWRRLLIHALTTLLTHTDHPTTPHSLPTETLILHRARLEAQRHLISLSAPTTAAATAPAATPTATPSPSPLRLYL